jgi:hypothetical protein
MVLAAWALVGFAIWAGMMLIGAALWAMTSPAPQMDVLP